MKSITVETPYKIVVNPSLGIIDVYCSIMSGHELKMIYGELKDLWINTDELKKYHFPIKTYSQFEFGEVVAFEPTNNWRINFLLARQVND